MYRGIWDDRNQHVNGKILLEQKEKEIMKLHNKVQALYDNPPLLDKRYPAIQEVSLHDRLRRNNRQLTEWLTKIDHQICITNVIQLWHKGQLTLRQAYERGGQL